LFELLPLGFNAFVQLSDFRLDHLHTLGFILANKNQKKNKLLSNPNKQLLCE
jgi:hypothetical protein